MTLKHIVAGNYGQVLRLTIIDTDTDAAADVSAYATSQVIYLRDELDNVSSALVAAFATDGSDGVVDYTLVDGDIDEAGIWGVKVVLTAASAELNTIWETFEVEA